LHSGVFPHRFFALVGVILVLFIHHFRNIFLCRCHACPLLIQRLTRFTISSLNFPPTYLLGRSTYAPALAPQYSLKVMLHRTLHTHTHTHTRFDSTPRKARCDSDFTEGSRSWRGNACPGMVDEEQVTGGGVLEEEGSKLMMCASSARGYSTELYGYITGLEHTLCRAL